MSAQVDIFNYALTILGAQTVSSPTENSKNARACLAVYDMVRMAELRKPPGWNFAIGMAKLAPNVVRPLFDRAYAFPLPADFLSLLTPFPERNWPDRDWVIQEGQIFTNDVRHRVNTPFFNIQPPYPPFFNFLLLNPAFAGVGAVYTDGTNTFTVLNSLFGGNILKTFGIVNPILTGTLTLVTGIGDATIPFASWDTPPPPVGPPSFSEPHLDIRYVQNITDTTKFDPLFVVALACKIAYTISDSITQSNAKMQEASKKYDAAILDAKRANAFEDVSEQFPQDLYHTIRF
jgi:hypothetical protein